MNKITSKLKKFLLILMLVVFSFSPLLTGCDINFYQTKQLRTPSISLSSINKSISWNEISGAENYEIYLNDALADTISVGTYDKMVYDFSSILEESGEYSLYIIATTSSVYRENSKKSNVCTYTYVKNTLVMPTTPDVNFDTAKITFTINSGVLSFVPLDDDNGLTYNIYIYSNSTGLRVYPLTSTMVNLVENNIMNKSEIYAIRIGYKDSGSDEEIIASDIKYYNNISSQFEGYTDNIYLFDGEIHDYYIQNQQELNNLVYYAFINRIEEYNIRISEEYKVSINEIYNETSVVENLNYAVYQGIRNLYETMVCYPNNINKGYVNINGNSYEYTIKVTYGGNKECDLSVYPTLSSLYSQARSTAYYQTTDYENLKTKYGNNYNDFASDKQFLYTTVTTSEQLYWAVENKITPVFENTNNRAYKIYSTAKDVLREIISDDMTDYEKALSIFDWIAINTQYDYTEYKTPAYTTAVVSNPLTLPCFFLEGVFMTGYAVCDGFSKAYSLMCNMIGIDCIRIVGDAKTASGSGGHAWNKVLFDKDINDDIPAQYYLVDITWTEIISEDGEQLSHTYFGLSDSDVSDTHFAFSGRNGKYGQYVADTSLYYYTFQTYTFQGEEYNLVIDSDEDMQRMFEYTLVDARDTIEFVIDYDYMVSVYNANNATPYLSDTGVVKEYITLENGKKLIKSEYDPSTDVYTYYAYTTTYDISYGWVYTSTEIVYNNYKLRTVFQNKVMKATKFDTQYFVITDENQLRTYDVVDGYEKQGMVLVLTQNLLIDNANEWVQVGEDEYELYENGEVAKTIKYFDENNITGEYYLYIDQAILNVAGNASEYTKNIYKIFNTFSTTNVKFDFTLVSNSEVSDNNESEVLFKMTVSSK